MNQHTHTDSRQANAPTPAEIAWIKVFVKENPGLRIGFQYYESDGEAVTAVVRDKENRVIASRDGSDRLALIKGIRGDALAGTLTQGAGSKANAGGHAPDPAASYIKTGRTGRTSTPAPAQPGNQDAERERMRMRIRIAEAEL